MTKTIEQKWIEVLEWAGWRECAERSWYNEASKTHSWHFVGFPPGENMLRQIPPMSLDAVHEIKKKLTDNQLANYSDHLDAIMDRFPRRNKFMPWKSHRELAEGQHCINALWRTVKG